MKRALLSSLGKSNWIYLIGLAAVAGVGISWFMNKESKSNYGSTMNSLYPIAHGTQPLDTYPHPAILSAHRGFRDFSRLDNSLPTPFVELNMPYDHFKNGVKLANIMEGGCTYIPTFDGNNFSKV